MRCPRPSDRFADESGGLLLFRAGDEQGLAKLADDDPYHVERAADAVREFDLVIAFGAARVIRAQRMEGRR